MNETVYSVLFNFPTSELRDRWLSWLIDEHHVQHVFENGAMQAEIVRLDEDENNAGFRCAVRYVYSSRSAHVQYLEGPAEDLRKRVEDQLKLLFAPNTVPKETTFRTVGDVLRTFP